MRMVNPTGRAPRVWAAAAILAIALASCRRDPRPELEQAVRTYLERLVVAYRTSDATVVDPLVGDGQGIKILGLIGVKRDSGIFLDATLLNLELGDVRRDGDRWRVETRERWYYRDRRIGTGEQVGEESADAYVLHYWFVRRDGRWILDELAFVGQPQVGRKSTPYVLEGSHLHGIVTETGAARPPGHASPGAAGQGPPAAPPAGTARPGASKP